MFTKESKRERKDNELIMHFKLKLFSNSSGDCKGKMKGGIGRNMRISGVERYL